jgi:transcriptional regulator with XRE-family HTH domain
MPKRPQSGPSQVVELLLSVAESLGVTGDRDLAALAGVSVETISNWRGGAVQELKPTKLRAVERALAARVGALLERAGAVRADPDLGLVPIEIEERSSPTALQRQLRDRIHYDYLGHRFLYFEPQGALAWESLIGAGYEQDLWLRGVDECAKAWIDPARHARGGCRGPIADALGYGPKAKTRGLDVVSLGPGEGGKELRILERVLDLEKRADQSLPFLTLALCDVSISLLLRAVDEASRRVLNEGSHANVLGFCADFEEGPLAFMTRLPTARGDAGDGLRLVVILGNVFGNVRDEQTFLRTKLADILRPGDLLWLEVGVRFDRPSQDPLFRLTEQDREETATEAHRRLLLEGPYRRWESAVGRPPDKLGMRVRVREDDEASRVPGSYNFVHDLVIEGQGRTITMLYSRRYQIEGLTRWLEDNGFAVERMVPVLDSKKQARVTHVLARRK